MGVNSSSISVSSLHPYAGEEITFTYSIDYEVKEREVLVFEVRQNDDLPAPPYLTVRLNENKSG